MRSEAVGTKMVATKDLNCNAGAQWEDSRKRVHSLEKNTTISVVDVTVGGDRAPCGPSPHMFMLPKRRAVPASSVKAEIPNDSESTGYTLKSKFEVEKNDAEDSDGGYSSYPPSPLLTRASSLCIKKSKESFVRDVTHELGVDVWSPVDSPPAVVPQLTALAAVDVSEDLLDNDSTSLEYHTADHLKSDNAMVHKVNGANGTKARKGSPLSISVPDVQNTCDKNTFTLSEVRKIVDSALKSQLDSLCGGVATESQQKVPQDHYVPSPLDQAWTPDFAEVFSNGAFETNAPSSSETSSIDLPFEELGCLLPEESLGEIISEAESLPITPLIEDITDLLTLTPTNVNRFRESLCDLPALPSTGETAPAFDTELATNINLDVVAKSVSDESNAPSNTSLRKFSFQPQSVEDRNVTSPTAKSENVSMTKKKKKTVSKSTPKKKSATSRSTQGRPCPHCDKLMSTKYKLERHIRTHTGEKPFKCQVCHSCFNQKSSLKTHSMIHAKAVLRDPKSTLETIKNYTVNGYTFESLGIPHATAIFDAYQAERH